MRSLLLAAVLVLAVGHTPAMAKQRHKHPKSLLESLLVPMPATVNFVNGWPADQPDTMGTALTDLASNTIYYRQPLDKFARAHEVGHLLDSQVLTDGDRHYFQRVMHAPAGAWNQGTGMDGGFQSPNEWFADYYAAAASGLNLSRESVSSYATLRPKRLRRFARALDRLGHRRDLQPYR